jgi:4-amino-4-deoxy-L-arabinose transferase-like glycosyltransferase
MHAIRGHSIVLLLLLLGLIGVSSTYLRLSETTDELFHISCGMEWWESGTYKTQPLHPPLARVVNAALPYLFMEENGRDSFESIKKFRDFFIERMWLSRLGNLPFYLFSCLLVFTWSRKLYGQSAGLCSLALYITLSSMTAHAGLATTDMVYTTLLLCALFFSMQWLESPTKRTSFFLGASIGLAFCSKFSMLVHYPFALWFMVCGLIVHNYRHHQALSPIHYIHIKRGILYVLPIIFLMIALIYRFSFEPLMQGVKDAYGLNQQGFGVWLYGPLRNTGVWYFFPVVFFFKTPLSFFLAFIIGCLHSGKKNAPLLAAAGILAVSMTSNINLGVRHVLPLYPLLAIPAGYGLVWIWQSKARFVAPLLVLWQLWGFVTSHPEHIAYFNELAGSRPEYITNDSDFDWGQNILLLDKALQSNGIDTFFLCARKDAIFNARILLDARVLQCPYYPVSGWIALSRAFRIQHEDNFTWLAEHQPVQPIGQTMDLYYIEAKP